jgi:hypothetical protein
MAAKVPISPGMPRGQAQDIARALDAANLAGLRTATEHATRLNNSFPMDGTERMEAPLPLQRLATDELPPASEHEGEMAYDTTLQRVVQSDGTTWEPIPTPGEIADAAFESVQESLDDTDTIEFVVVEEPPNITANLKDGAVQAIHLGANSVGPAALAPSGVTPGEYAAPDLSIDEDGRITGAIGGTPSPFVKLGGATITTGVAFIDVIFNAQIVATPFKFIDIYLGGIVGDTEDQQFNVQFSNDAGATYFTTNYKYVSLNTADDGTAFNHFNTGTASAGIMTAATATAQVGFESREGWHGVIRLMRWQENVNPRVSWDACYHAANAGQALINARGNASRNSSTPINALRFFFTTGLVVLGDWAAFGLR